MFAEISDHIYFAANCLFGIIPNALNVIKTETFIVVKALLFFFTLENHTHVNYYHYFYPHVLSKIKSKQTRHVG